MPPRLMDDLALASTCGRPDIAACATQLSAEMHADTAGRTAAARWIVCWDLVGGEAGAGGRAAGENVRR